MNCEHELFFVNKLLENFLVPFTLLRRGVEQPASAPSIALRRLLQPAAGLGPIYEALSHTCCPRVIYRRQDELDCTMLYFQVKGGDEPVLAMVGPYLLQPVSPELLAENAGKFPNPAHVLPSLELYYREVPYLSNDSQLLVLLYTLGEYLWGKGRITVQDLPVHIPTTALSWEGLKRSAPSNYPLSARNQKYDRSLSMEALENRYADEEKLIRAVSAGQTGQAEIALNRISARQMEPRTTLPLRNMKNYFIELNTLLRKAAEYGHVHPLHVDRMFSKLVREIEACSTVQTLTALGPKMVRHYCQIVQDCSMKGHSHLISKLLSIIEADLMADLSLSALAKQLNVNSSYLSALFKKELGSTLTEYVSTRRISYAMFLLETTSLQIQTIAQQCGIPDVNYFTRTFKKYAGVTPKEYRTAQRAV